MKWVEGRKEKSAGGDSCGVNNYRPISIIPVYCESF